MKRFSNILEVKSSSELLRDEITKYINKVKRVLPDNVNRVLYVIQKYDIRSKEDLEDIKNATKSEIISLSKKLNIPVTEIEDLKKQLKDLKTKIRLLPQYQSQTEREELEAGKLATNDLTIDLETTAGKNAAAKMYMPIALKIVNQFVGKTNLSKEDLISAALEAMTNAMNDWNPDDNTSFKTYLGYRVRQQILNDINNYNLTVNQNDYGYKKFKSSSQSIDNWLTGDDKVDQDRLVLLGTEEQSSHDENIWKDLFNIIEKNFNNRKVEIFYRFFGLNGYKRELSKDIAKDLGVSLAYIRNTSINPIISFLKSDRKASKILSEIKDIYTESLMSSLFGSSKKVITETLINDDIFILLEDMTRWEHKNVFLNAMRDVFSTLDEKTGKLIRDFLTNDFDYLDKYYKQHKTEIIKFLNMVYPSENFNIKTDVDILEYMEELCDAYKKYH